LKVKNGYDSQGFSLGLALLVYTQRANAVFFNNLVSSSYLIIMPFFLISDDVIDILRVMRYKNRSLSKRIKALVERFPIVVVSGARQVGKSTMLKHLFEEYDIVLFDPVTDVGNARSDPDLFLDNHPSPMLLDEIQYAPELVPAIKRRVDQNKKAGMYPPSRFSRLISP